ncbi:unnamed protein product [Absidia cylindrospora]
MSQRIVKPSDDNQYASDDEHEHFTRGDAKQMKRYAEELLQHERSTIKVKSDGTVIITPHPRQLPNEILEHIINYLLEETDSNMHRPDSRQMDQQLDLCTCTLVNKQFYAIAHPLLWREPVFEFDPTQLQRMLDCLATATTKQPPGHHIKRLELDFITCTDTELLLLMTHIPHLETLSLANPNGTDTYLPITSTSLQHLPRYCSKLTSLSLSHIRLSEATIRAVGQHCHQLTKLELYCVVGLRDDFLSALSNCPLKKIRYCHVGERILTEKLVMDMTRFQDLTELNLTIFEPSSVIMTIANNTTAPWPRLKILNLGQCDAIDDATFICFIKSHPHLQVIRLDGATLTDASLDAMAVSLRDLRRLILIKVNSISSGGVRRWIHNSCQRLVSAKFQDCDQIVARDVLETYNDHVGFLNLNEHDIAKIRSAQGNGND